ncbi:MAG: DUF4296 domain-containing protein, partial [Bacteroidota bacterium]|nr:DUF4296 domain-containing protein [Bacteroidota bacterium]
MKHWILFLFMLLSGCDQQVEPPEGLLDRETFKQVLTEAQLIESRMNHEMVVEHRKEVPMQRYYEEVFTLHGTDQEQFERTFEYYASKPEELRVIYEEIIAELSRRKDLVPIV